VSDYPETDITRSLSTVSFELEKKGYNPAGKIEKPER
jgi:uncharacterized protein (UPF0297 family)